MFQEKQVYEIDGEPRICLLKKNELQQGVPLPIWIDDTHAVSLFLVDGVVYCTTLFCPHQHSPTIGSMGIIGYEVECPLHGWRFDIRNGCRVGSEGGKLQRFEVHENDGYLFISETDLLTPAWMRSEF